MSNLSTPFNTFWNWFQQHEQEFFKVVSQREHIEEGFFDLLSNELDLLKEGLFFLAGMKNENTVELIFTPDGAIKNIAFVEMLVEAAPKLPNWTFTALKSAINIEDLSIKMGGFDFNNENLSFYANEHEYYPDEVDIVVVHQDFNEDDAALIINGVFIFMDNYLGELNSLVSIDNISVGGKESAEQDLIPISKLKDYLIWREKEFVEKYDAMCYNSENDNFATLEASLDNEMPLIAIVNRALLDWDGTASHPWILMINISYEDLLGDGFPDEKTYALLDQFEDNILDKLKEQDGYLNIGRQTAAGERLLYFACKEFRKPSLVVEEIIQKYSDQINADFDIYKDKYWQSLEHFKPQVD
jgi:hypothetical protein